MRTTLRAAMLASFVSMFGCESTPPTAICPGSPSCPPPAAPRDSAPQGGPTSTTPEDLTEANMVPATHGQSGGAVKSQSGRYINVSTTGSGYAIGPTQGLAYQAINGSPALLK